MTLTLWLSIFLWQHPMPHSDPGFSTTNSWIHFIFSGVQISLLSLLLPGLSKLQSIERQKNMYFRKESSRKTSTSALLTTSKPLTVWITTNCGKFFKRWEYQTTWPASWEICMQVKKQQLELDMKQQTGSKSGKEYIKPVYCHPAY